MKVLLWIRNLTRWSGTAGLLTGTRCFKGESSEADRKRAADRFIGIASGTGWGSERVEARTVARVPRSCMSRSSQLISTRALRLQPEDLSRSEHRQRSRERVCVMPVSQPRSVRLHDFASGEICTGCAVTPCVQANISAAAPDVLSNTQGDRKARSLADQA